MVTTSLPSLLIVLTKDVKNRSAFDELMHNSTVGAF